MLLICACRIALENLPSKFYDWHMTKKVTEEMMRLVQTQLASAGGKARAARYDYATLREWGKRGGRPKKKVQQKKRGRR